MGTVSSVVDVMSVPAMGDAGRAIVSTDRLVARGPVHRCDLLIIGGGTGGAAAALAATSQGIDVCLTEETDWLGGQFSAQGVSALDEHDHIERFGGTAQYYDFRNRLRRHYRDLAKPEARIEAFNPGRCWVTRLAFEPAVAARTVRAMIGEQPGRLSLFLRTKPFAAASEGASIRQVSVVNLETREVTVFEPRLVIDATELGDLLALADVEHVVGAEAAADTGEPGGHPTGHREHCVQSFTYTFGLERGTSGETNLIERPTDYERNRSSQPYSLEIEVHGGEIYGEHSGHLRYSVFDTMPDTKGSLWTFRRLIDASLFPQFPRDISR